MRLYYKKLVENIVTKLYDKSIEKEKRRKLRRNPTNAEELVWRFLRNRQLMSLKFRRQYSVNKYVLDFYCSEIKFAIELDGGTHLSAVQKEKDEKRQKKIRKVWN